MPDVPNFALPGLMHIDHPQYDAMRLHRQVVRKGEKVTLVVFLPDDDGGKKNIQNCTAHLRLMRHGRQILDEVPMMIEANDTASAEVDTEPDEFLPGDYEYDVCFESPEMGRRWTRRYFLSILSRITPPTEGSGDGGGGILT